MRPTSPAHFSTSSLVSETPIPSGPTKFRNFYVPLTPRTTTTDASSLVVGTTASTTTSAAAATEKSVLETLIETMLNESGESAPTTNIPEPDTATVPNSSNDSSFGQLHLVTELPNEEESSTFAQSTISRQVPSNDDAVSTENGEDSTELPTTIYITPSSSAPTSASETTTMTTTTTMVEPTSEAKSVENAVSSFSQENSLRYIATKSPAFKEYLQSKISDAEGYPKNHRAKWSEVHYPTDKFLFKWHPKNQTHSEKDQPFTESTNPEKPSENVTDYVQAIFESIKSADEQQQQGTDEPGARTEIKTSISSSSRVVSSQPQVVSFSQLQEASQSNIKSIGPFVPSLTLDKLSDISLKKTPSFDLHGKSLKSATKSSQMTEICYRGRCVMKGAR